MIYACVNTPKCERKQSKYNIKVLQSLFYCAPTSISVVSVFLYYCIDLSKSVHGLFSLLRLIKSLNKRELLFLIFVSTNTPERDPETQPQTIAHILNSPLSFTIAFYSLLAFFSSIRHFWKPQGDFFGLKRLCSINQLWTVTLMGRQPCSRLNYNNIHQSPLLSH